MIVDAHVHLFSPRVRENRSAFFPEEPAFRLLYDSPKSRLVGAAETLEMMDAEGVDRAVVFGFPWRSEETFRRENDFILDAVSRHPDRFAGLACFDPLAPGAAREAERCLDAGLSGVGELAFYEDGVTEAGRDAMAETMALCRDRGAPVMLHTNEPVGHVYPGKSPNTLAQIYAVAKAFPENKIIFAHWGGGIFFYRLLKREVREVLAKVYFDTAASPFLYTPDIYPAAAALAGADKILLGTDFPLLRPGRYFRDMAESGISEADRTAMCGGNAARLFGFS
jgi:predicted TIM-barrel fold metal-dependent hydrolase